MALAVACAALLLAVVGVLVLPLLTRERALPERGQFDRAVYRDQLREVERDVARGVLTENEAQSARLEIQRRLLAVAGDGEARPQRRSPLLAVVAAGFVVVVGAGLYWRLGAPALPDAPMASLPVAAAPHADLREAAAKLQQRLQENPRDGDGWLLYARTEAAIGDWGKAGDAYQHAIALGQTGADVHAAYGEVLVLAASRIVSPAAHEEFASALSVDPGNVLARYYLALGQSQAGEVKPAIAAWLALAAELPADSPIRDAIRRGVAEAAQSGGMAVPPMPAGGAPGATAGGETVSPDERAKMVDGMVAKLAAELQARPDDVDGWVRLGTAYGVLGKRDQAVDAFDHAAKLKPDDAGIKLRTAEVLLAGLPPEDAPPARAVDLLHQVAAVTPDAPEVLWYLGVVAIRQGDVAQARQEWTRLLSVLPGDGDDRKAVQQALGALP